MSRLNHRLRFLALVIAVATTAASCGAGSTASTTTPTVQGAPPVETTIGVILTSGASTIPAATPTRPTRPTPTTLPSLSFRLPSDVTTTPTTSIHKVAPTTSTPAKPATAADARIARWSLSPGECQCPWTLELFGNGTGVFATKFIEVDVVHDAATFASLVDGVTGKDLTAGSTDCGREVDGNAPTLELAGIGEFDECKVILDIDHPLIVHLSNIRDGLLTQSQLAEAAGS